MTKIWRDAVEFSPRPGGGSARSLRVTVGNALAVAEAVVPREAEYRPFPVVETRDEAQALMEVPLLCQRVPLPPGLRLLEIGCGFGVSLRPLAAGYRPRRLVGIDVDRGLVTRARARAADEGIAAEVLEADVRALPFADGSFDVVFDFGTCFHIARRHRALKEIERVLAPGGLFLTETRLNQFVSHPLRSWGRRLPWAAAPALRPWRDTLLWAVRTKEACR